MRILEPVAGDRRDRKTTVEVAVVVRIQGRRPVVTKRTVDEVGIVPSGGYRSIDTALVHLGLHGVTTRQACGTSGAVEVVHVQTVAREGLHLILRVLPILEEDRRVDRQAIVHEAVAPSDAPLRLDIALHILRLLVAGSLALNVHRDALLALILTDITVHTDTGLDVVPDLQLSVATEDVVLINIVAVDLLIDRIGVRVERTCRIGDAGDVPGPERTVGTDVVLFQVIQIDVRMTPLRIGAERVESRVTLVSRVVVVTIGVLIVDTDRQAIDRLEGGTGRQVTTGSVAVRRDTLAGDVREGDTRRVVLARAREGDVRRVADTVLVQVVQVQAILPLRRLAEARVRRIPGVPRRVLAAIKDRTPAGVVVVIIILNAIQRLQILRVDGRIVVEGIHLRVGAHVTTTIFILQVEIDLRHVYRQRMADIDLHTLEAIHTTLCGDDDRAITTARAIQGSRRRAFQDVDRSHVVHIHAIRVVGDHTVDHIDRRAIRFYLLCRITQRFLLTGQTLRRYHDLIQILGIGNQTHAHVRTDSHLLLNHTHIRDLQRFLTIGNFQRELTVEVCHRTDRRTLHYNRSANDRLPILSGDDHARDIRLLSNSHAYACRQTH